MNKLISFFIFVSFSFSFDKNNLYNYLLLNKNNFHIEPKLLMAIIKIESNFNPYCITINVKKKYVSLVFNTFKKYLHNSVIKYYYKYISIKPKNKIEAVKAFRILKYIDKNFNYINTYDLGLMQINKANIAENELSFLLNYKKNIEKGVKILYKCFLNYRNTYKGFIKSIECYNKGYRKVFNGSYYKKFIKSYTNFNNIFTNNVSTIIRKRQKSVVY